MCAQTRNRASGAKETMDKAILETMWVPNEILPAEFKITAVKQQTGKLSSGREYIFYTLTVQNNLIPYEYDAKFGDKNFLINTLSAQPESWIGRNITIGIVGKYKQLL